MIFLGIDPGIETVGFGLIEQTDTTQDVLDYGCIKTPASLSLPERLAMIRSDLQQLLSDYQPTVAGVETIFFQTNVKTAINVAQGRGVVLNTLHEQGMIIIEPSPLQVKMNVTGDGKADKLQVQMMVQRLLHLDELPQPDDAADALAIALCTINEYKIHDLST